MNSNNLKIRPQYTRRRFLSIAATGAFAAGTGLAAHSAPDVIFTNARVSVNRGLDYLRHIQETNGSWGEYPATTSLALAAFLRNGKTEVKETGVAKWRSVSAAAGAAQRRDLRSPRPRPRPAQLQHCPGDHGAEPDEKPRLQAHDPESAKVFGAVAVR